MMIAPEFNIPRFKNQLLKTIRDSIAVDWVISSDADIEQGIKSAIWINSSYIANSDTTFAICQRKILIRLWAPDGTAVAFGKEESSIHLRHCRITSDMGRITSEHTPSYI
jgi:hypothetical protein